MTTSSVVVKTLSHASKGDGNIEKDFHSRNVEMFWLLATDLILGLHWYLLLTRCSSHLTADGLQASRKSQMAADLVLTLQ